VVALTGVVALTSWVREAPLRGDGLTSTQAEVVQLVQHRHRADTVEVRYDVPGQGPLVARIPVSARLRAGQRVEVRYDPADPGHVRTAVDWSPAYSRLFLVLPVFLLITLVLAAGRSWRAGRS